MQNEYNLNYVVDFARKYKGKKLSRLLEDTSYATWIVDHYDDLDPALKRFMRDYLDKHSDRLITGSTLTDRIKNLQHNRSFEDIKQNIKIEDKFIVTSGIISTGFMMYIRNLYDICPQGAGCFMDYLFRYLICREIGREFSDSRADRFYKICQSFDDEKIKKLYTDSYNEIKNDSEPIRAIISIFIVSWAHLNDITDKSFQQYSYLSTREFKKEYLSELLGIFKWFSGRDILLNPTLSIPYLSAEADIIIDDKLIDLKVTKHDNDEYEMLQLLGYTVLAKLQNIDIREVYIIDFYKGFIKSLDISNWSGHTNYLKYLQINVSKEELDNLQQIEKLDYPVSFNFIYNKLISCIFGMTE